MTHPTPAPRSELLWAAVDFDGTIAKASWTPENPTSDLGEPIERNIAQCWALSEAGYNIVIHTARPWSDYEAIELWLTYYLVPFKAIVCGKLLAACYVDDRAIAADETDWVAKAKAIAPIGQPR